VKVLTYNLYWWNLFKKRKGNWRSAGRLIAESSRDDEFDFMAFQECEDPERVLWDAKMEGLPGDYETIPGGHAIAIAYRKSAWTLLAAGAEEVGEDSKAQYYGKRSAEWARLQNENGLVVFFVNHHGPLPISAGGGCTGSAAALNMMQVIAGNAHQDDRIILVGDFNAKVDSSRIQELERRLHRVYTGTAMDGVDHVFSNCDIASANVSARNLGSGGSDHDALSVVFNF